MPEYTAKDIRVAPVSAKDANALVQRVHYSGKVVPNSQLHFGVFLDNKLEGVMQFGPSMDKRKTITMVAGTAWNDFIELNRMAFSDRLPRNSESRAIGVAMRLIRQHYPHIEWVISFADGTQCGDGTIYRASGFLLTGIRENTTLVEFKDGTRIANMTLTAHWDTDAVAQLCKRLGAPVRARSILEWRELGGKELPGFQLRYIYFLHASARERLTVPVIPFDQIQAKGAGMYRGKPVNRSTRAKGQDAGNHPALGGSTPTRALHSSGNV